MSNVVTLPVAQQPQVAPPASNRPASMTTPVVIEKYIAVRDKIAETKKRHTDELARFNLAMATMEGWLLSDLQTQGVDQMRAAAGTVFTSTRTSCKVTDWQAALAFIRENEAWDLLEARISKTAALGVVEDTKKPIPGVAFDSEVVVNVRRASN